MQYPLLILTAVLLGGLAAFAYSYAPLHRAKDWEIAYLRERLQTRTEQVETLEEAMQAAEANADGQPSTDQLEALQAQLDEARGLSASLQGKVRDLEQKLTQVTQSRDSWKKKHGALSAEAEAAREALANTRARTPVAEAPATSPAAGEAPGATPASAPPAAPAQEPDPTEAAAPAP